MHANAATTLSFCAAAISFSVAWVGARLAALPQREYRYLTPASCAAGSYALCEAIVAGSMSDAITVWVARIGMCLLSLHAISWVAFFAAWEKRPLSSVERVAVALCIGIAPLPLVPGVALRDTISEHTVGWLGVTYRDPDAGPFGAVTVAITSLGIGLAAHSAYRKGRADRQARIVAWGFIAFLVVAVVDTLTGIGWIALPYLASCAIAIVPLLVASVVAAKFADHTRQLASQTRELVAQAEELAKTRAALVERERLAAVGQLAAVVAHEVRNPVAIIFNAVATLDRRMTRSGPDRELLEIVRHEAERLTRLVAQLLDSVRPFELRTISGSVESVVLDAVNSATKGASVEPTEVVVESMSDITVEADAVLLVQAISNLISNALVSPNRRSPVRLAVRLTSDDVVHVEVVDDGKGVSEENEARLFSPFFTTRATGTGLGLSLVKRIAEAHGGSVGFERRAPGAAFVLSIPRVRPSPARVASPLS